MQDVLELSKRLHVITRYLSPMPHMLVISLSVLIMSVALQGPSLPPELGSGTAVE